MTGQDDLLAKLAIAGNDRPSRSRQTPLSLIFMAQAVIGLGIWAGWTLLAKPAPQAAIMQPAVAENEATSGTAASGTAASATSAGSGAALDDQQATAASAEADNSVLDASGYVVARRLATVSAEITGRITDVLVEEGVRVEEGQVLARLDDAIAKVNLDLAVAQADARAASVAGIEAQLAEAKNVLARTTRLAKQEFSSEANLTRAQADVASLTANLAQSKADLRVARLEANRRREILDDHTVRAPFTGVVIDKNAQPGEIIAPGSAGGGFTRTGICTLVDMASLEIEVDVNESYLARVSEGQGVVARLDAYPEWEIPARVLAIVPTANRDKATVRVRIALLVRDNRILPDMGIKVSFKATQTAAGEAS